MKSLINMFRKKYELIILRNGIVKNKDCCECKSTFDSYSYNWKHCVHYLHHPVAPMCDECMVLRDIIDNKYFYPQDTEECDSYGEFSLV